MVYYNVGDTMNEENSNVYKRDFINKLFTFSLSYVNRYSSFIYENMENTWKLYVNNQDSSTKKKRYYDKLNKEIDKLSLIENKKSSYYDYSFIADDIRNCVDSMEFKCNNKFVSSLMQDIFYIGGLSQLLAFLLKKYDDINRKIKRKEENSKTKMVLPQKSSGKKQSISYIVDKNGYIYANLKSDNGVLVFDKKSFQYECKLFDEAIANNKELNMIVPNEIDGKISPFEKKRRIYIQTMLDLAKTMNKLKMKNIDLTHPVEQYYYCAKLLVDNLYKEACEFADNKSFLNLLFNETINAYGCGRMLVDYEHISVRFIDTARTLDKYSIEEINDTARIAKERRNYLCFKDIEFAVPLVSDIYKALNDKLIISISYNNKEYLADMENTINRFTKYMSVPEIVHMYGEFKDAIFTKSDYSSSFMNEKYIQLQMIISKVIGDKMNISSEKATNKYLNEEVAYK